jgi:hypothetical protein
MVVQFQVDNRDTVQQGIILKYIPPLLEGYIYKTFLESDANDEGNAWPLYSENMPACGDKSSCKNNSLPLDDGHHACSLCDVELHGICGRFYNEDSIKHQNICSLCKIALECKNHDIKHNRLSPLPFPMMQQEVA